MNDYAVSNNPIFKISCEGYMGNGVHYSLGSNIYFKSQLSSTDPITFYSIIKTEIILYF